MRRGVNCTFCPLCNDYAMARWFEKLMGVIGIWEKVVDPAEQHDKKAVEIESDT